MRFFPQRISSEKNLFSKRKKKSKWIIKRIIKQDGNDVDDYLI